ncbi:heavy metal-associated isoprenylated plant protein 41-like [Triticum urartu]|nr:heavy metal-associated isoprenylated plant protein 41-like [Triticum urartu]
MGFDRKEAAAAAEEEEVKWLKHYSSTESILIVGDGDLSFSWALAIAFCSAENLVATSIDSYEDLTRKYSKAESNIFVLKMMGATILHGIDANTMKLHNDLKMRRFDRIVFNFPHAGFKGKEDRMDVINAHKKLVRGFLHNASHLIRPNGEIHVSHKTGNPYDKWDIEELALGSSLIKVDQVSFRIEDYPGYNQKRGDGANCDEPFALGACCTFKFCIRGSKKLKSAHRNMISSHGSSTLSEPISTVQIAKKAHEPYSLGLAKRHEPCFPVSIDGMVASPSFDRHGTSQPLCSIAGSSLNALPILGGNLPAPPQQQPWYQHGPILQLLWSGGYSHFAWEYLRSLLREYEAHRQMTPGGRATDVNYSVLLEHCFRESIACALLQEWLQRAVVLHGRR